MEEDLLQGEKVARAKNGRRGVGGWGEMSGPASGKNRRGGDFQEGQNRAGVRAIKRVFF